ncbi:MAG: M23 family metallopeptidase, partial [Planctomycetes bacterium]|nr:M23 family metallopeptidase [Planctomycetota bacterium]
MHTNHRITGFMLVCFLAPSTLVAAAIEPLVRVVDLDVGETRQVTLHDGTKATVTLLELIEERDSVRNAVRKAQVKVKANDQTISLVSSTYHLPTAIGGVQIDCPVTKGYIQNSSKANAWGLVKDARLRLWPAGSPWIRPGTFIYPVKQKWFASDTQMANVPCYVNACDIPGQKNIYYHYGLDFGGSEGMVEVVAATDGLVVSVGDYVLDGHKDTPVSPRYDVVYILDDRGWYYRYSHLQMIATPVIPGKHVKMGQRIGLMGKEGGSGGWS